MKYKLIYQTINGKYGMFVTADYNTYTVVNEVEELKRGCYSECIDYIHKLERIERCLNL